MARRMYTSGLNRVAELLATLDLRAQLVDADYTFAVGNGSMSDVASAARIGSAADLTMSSSGAAADAADFTVTDAPSGETIVGAVIYEEGASDAARTLIGFVNEDASGTAISQLTDGNNVTVTINVAGLIVASDPQAP